MTAWQEMRLSDCCEFISDGDHQAPPKADTGIPFITISNINNNRLDFNNTAFVPESYYESLDYKRKAIPGDVLYSVVGTLGIPVFVQSSRSFVFQRNHAILRSGTAFSSRFLYYSLLNPNFYRRATSAAVGTAQRVIGLTTLRNMTIKVPSLAVQQKIAGILSAYDDQIDNNQQQMKLLEETVHLIYNHHISNSVDSLSWPEAPLGTIASFTRGKNITKAEVTPGHIPVVAGGLAPSCYHNKSNAQGPAVTISASGANAGFANLYFEDIWASDCSFIDDSCPDIYFVYCFIKSQSHVLRSMQKGAAQPHVYAKDVNQLSLRIPPHAVRKEFQNIVSPYFGKIKTLKQQQKLLQEARDRLLPKLLSGEIEV